MSRKGSKSCVRVPKMGSKVITMADVIDRVCSPMAILLTSGSGKCPPIRPFDHWQPSRSCQEVTGSPNILNDSTLIDHSARQSMIDLSAQPVPMETRLLRVPVRKRGLHPLSVCTVPCDLRCRHASAHLVQPGVARTLRSSHHSSP